MDTAIVAIVFAIIISVAEWRAKRCPTNHADDLVRRLDNITHISTKLPTKR